MTTPNLKIGLASFAHTHAGSYARVLASMPGVEVLATDPDHADRAPESGGPAMAAELGVEYVPDLDALLAWEPDGVVVCAENARHRAYVERIAAAGAHVLCEKPLATSVADAEAMVAACDEAGVFLMVAFPVRFSPAFTALREAVDAGTLGTVAAVTGTNNGRLPSGRSWFTDPALAGGGAMTDHTVHVADLMDALLGGAPATSVYAQSNAVLHAGEVDVETGGLVSIGYATDAGDVVVTIDCSWSKPADYPTWGGLTLQVVGSDGVADMDAFGQRVDGFSQSAAAPVWLAYGANLDEALVAEFVDGVRTGRAPQPDGAVGVRTTRIVEAAYASAAAGRPVALHTTP
ncbi:oxidoreductase domain protein [Beutenbergia cavernae DSM 12333]|uniref:Oxidoreductase domain protein n=1 Tax=Beutenbergia cavernae (strain ATCC BAA-8 / DSM 12333 / CCUG 43141 / JCM 11478 / NBRC 16432 / NCIMB 13614 / HKI 0122) TaxID=471853 RepID=C5C403_BEUC1|nr:Gfo/Idh/MocA family oxidoreductase [Beutenbergia cavernae]ACQ79916.1 oxidoreductase domain protein [Beutenbergia cavernae DSM 12333]